MAFKIDQLTREITKALQEYTAEVEEGIRQAQEQVAKDTAQRLKETSPKKTGDYAKGWRARRLDDNTWIVHNATDYQLTHLLEYGHAKRDGGRVAPRVHIRPAEEQAIRDFEQAVEKVIRG